MDVVLFGPPGAGKGTQARRLVDILQVPQISTGDMMRAERASGSTLGKEFDSFMARGALVPDELVLALVEQRLAKPDAKNGAMFDGYPRTVPQAEALDRMLSKTGRRIERVISLEVSLPDIVERIVGRRVCKSCGHAYHLRYSPPPSSGICGECGGILEQRKDDTEEIVRKRFADYEQITLPLLGYYDAKKIVSRVDGNGELDAVTKRISTALSSRSD